MFLAGVSHPGLWAAPVTANRARADIALTAGLAGRCEAGKYLRGTFRGGCHGRESSGRKGRAGPRWGAGDQDHGARSAGFDTVTDTYLSPHH